MVGLFAGTWPDADTAKPIRPGRLARRKAEPKDEPEKLCDGGGLHLLVNAPAADLE